MNKRKAWNKGLTKENDERVLKYTSSNKNNYKNGNIIPWNKGKKLSEENIKNLSIAMRKAYSSKDIVNQRRGRGIQGWYKNIWCDSKWELAFVIYSLENNIKFIRNKKGFQYSYNNIQHTYYPDFFLTEENMYIEIKGWENEKDKEKKKQFQYSLKVLYKKDLIDILNYVKEKYGKDFEKLYDKVESVNG